MNPMDPMDPLYGEWLPLVNGAQLAPGTHLALTLAGQPLVAWRGEDGQARVWRDHCPHRGSRLSLGRVSGNVLACAYHGWQFGGDGACVRMPAHPQRRPPAAACARTLPVRERYGMVWACLGEPAGELDLFPEYEKPGVRSIHLAPAEVATSAPRLVENFLDMAHFAFVHTDILGDEAHTEVPDYEVEVRPDRVTARNCHCWQPSGLPGQPGLDIEYVYEVRRPMAAMLTKFAAPARGDGPPVAPDVMHILLALSPVDECRTRAWLLSVFENNSDSSEQELYDFNAEIFQQDVPIVESQLPKWLPLHAGEEVAQAADRMSMAYRRWLRERAWTYGTSLGAAARAAEPAL